jgi:hypothetical protein
MILILLNSQNSSWRRRGSKGEFRKVTVPVGSFEPHPWGLWPTAMILQALRLAVDPRRDCRRQPSASFGLAQHTLGRSIAWVRKQI